MSTKQKTKALKPEVLDTTAFVVNIEYSPTRVLTRKNKDGKKEEPKPLEECPVSMEIAIPESIGVQKNEHNYFDVIESYVYNLVSSINGRLVTHCQIYLS